MKNLAISVEGLNKYFGNKHVVKDLSMQIQRGEIYGFLGPNGSGKTTSIRMMCGLLTPDSGHGTCLGFDILRDSAQIKRRIGYMTQRFSLWENLTVRENLVFIARMYSMKSIHHAVDECMVNMGLIDRQHQLAKALSGGWKQRLALAACILHQPELLLLDEPTAGVDPKARREFWHTLHQLAATGISVLVSTHYMDEAERCHKLAYIAYSRLLVQGTVQEVIQSQGLSTLAVQGQHLIELETQLIGQPGVAQTALLGNVLHVTGHDVALLHQTLQRLAPHHHIAPIETGLEDVFSHLITLNPEQDTGQDKEHI